jgi:hypothetical protein
MAKIDERHGSPGGGIAISQCARPVSARCQLKPEDIMRSDSEIERDVKEELQWDPDLDASGSNLTLGALV